MVKRNLWDSLQEPINPHLCLLLGILNVLYGLWALLPFAENPIEAYEFLDLIAPGQFWGGCVLIIGLVLVTIHKWGEPYMLGSLMAINGILWTVMSALTALGDWQSNVWILMLGVAVYSTFVAANLKTNFKAPRNKKNK